jgi:hypothetical protein
MLITLEPYGRLPLENRRDRGHVLGHGPGECFAGDDGVSRHSG